MKFQRKKKAPEETVEESPRYPDWILKEDARYDLKAMFDWFNEQIEAISVRIEDGDELKLRERTISKNAVVKQFGAATTFFKNHPEFTSYIEKQNAVSDRKYLDRIEKDKARAQLSERTADMTRGDAINEVRQTRKAISNLQSETLQLQLIQLVDSGVLENNSIVKKQIKVLKDEIKELTEQLEIELNKNRQINDLNDVLMDKVSELEDRLREMGQTVKPTLYSVKDGK